MCGHIIEIVDAHVEVILVLGIAERPPPASSEPLGQEFSPRASNRSWQTFTLRISPVEQREDLGLEICRC